MAWQLIYTSAPRLLEAGRTGFGTVARHRPVGGMLAAAIERLSQFARLPGHDPKRAVYSHRRLTINGAEYHVLSCVRDAGSDYTGRTNHIAHHLIAEESEVLGLEDFGITPGDVLLTMPWRESWTDAPRYLDSSEEVDLASLKARPSRAWAEITGNPRHAALLSAQAAAKSCYLLTPEKAPVLPLLREGLNEIMAQSWEVTFTTCLEPNDDVADFRWIGIPASSPLRAQVEGSARQVLDLTSPHSLPQPPEPVFPAFATVDEIEVQPSPAKVRLHPPQPSVHQESPANFADSSDSMHGHGDYAAWPAAPVGKTRRKNHMLPLVLIGLVLVLAGACALIWLQISYSRQQSDSQTLSEEIAKVWSSHGLKLEQTRQALEARAAAAESNERAECRRLVKLYDVEFTKIERLLEAPQSREDISAPEMESRDDFADFELAVERWQRDVEAQPLLDLWQSNKEPKTLQGDVQRWKSKVARAWRDVASSYVRPPASPAVANALFTLKDRVNSHLEGARPPQGSSADWIALYGELSGKGTPPWMAAWQRLEDTKPAEKDSLEKLCASIRADGAAPQWLKIAAEEKQKQANEANAPVVEKERPTPPEVGMTPAIKIQDVADAFESSHGIYIHYREPDETNISIEVFELSANPQPELYVGGTSAADLQPWQYFPGSAASYRPTQMKLDETVIIQGKKLEIKVNNKVSRLVGCTPDKRMLFDIRLVTAANHQTELLKFTPAPEVKMRDVAGQQTVELGAFIKRLHFANQDVSSVYHLVAPNKLSYDLLPDGGDKLTIASSASPTERAARKRQIDVIEQDIKNLEGAIESDDRAIKEMAASKLADKEKRLKRLEEDRARHQETLDAKRAELANLKAQLTAPAPRIPTAQYFLQAQFPLPHQPATQNICVLQLTESSP